MLDKSTGQAAVSFFLFSPKHERTEIAHLVEAKELKAGDLVLIGTMFSPEAMAWRQVESVRLVFGLNTLIRFKDGTERALRDDEQLETIEARA